VSRVLYKIIKGQFFKEWQVATDLEEIKELRGRVEALRLYAKKADESLKKQNQFAELEIRAEHRCGELLPQKPVYMRFPQVFLRRSKS